MERGGVTIDLALTRSKTSKVFALHQVWRANKSQTSKKRPREKGGAKAPLLKVEKTSGDVDQEIGTPIIWKEGVSLLKGGTPQKGAGELFFGHKKKKNKSKL